MDEFSETYAWGLNDLRPVKFQPYAFELTTEKPVFRRQHHMAKVREKNFATEWAKVLIDSGREWLRMLTHRMPLQW